MDSEVVDHSMGVSDGELHGDDGDVFMDELEGEAVDGYASPVIEDTEVQEMIDPEEMNDDYLMEGSKSHEEQSPEADNMPISEASMGIEDLGHRNESDHVNSYGSEPTELSRTKHEANGSNQVILEDRVANSEDKIVADDEAPPYGTEFETVLSADPSRDIPQDDLPSTGQASQDHGNLDSKESSRDEANVAQDPTESIPESDDQTAAQQKETTRDDQISGADAQEEDDDDVKNSPQNEEDHVSSEDSPEKFEEAEEAEPEEQDSAYEVSKENSLLQFHICVKFEDLQFFLYPLSAEDAMQSDIYLMDAVPDGEVTLEYLCAMLREVLSRKGDLEMSLNDELELSFPQLHLSIGEDNLYSKEMTIQDVADLYVGLLDNTPSELKCDELELVVSLKERFLHTFSVMRSLMEEGGGLQDLEGLDEDVELKGDPSEDEAAIEHEEDDDVEEVPRHLKHSDAEEENVSDQDGNGLENHTEEVFEEDLIAGISEEKAQEEVEYQAEQEEVDEVEEVERVREEEVEEQEGKEVVHHATEEADNQENLVADLEDELVEAKDADSADEVEDTNASDKLVIAQKHSSDGNPLNPLEQDAEENQNETVQTKQESEHDTPGANEFNAELDLENEDLAEPSHSHIGNDFSNNLISSNDQDEQNDNDETNNLMDNEAHQNDHQPRLDNTYKNDDQPTLNDDRRHAEEAVQITASGDSNSSAAGSDSHSQDNKQTAFLTSGSKRTLDDDFTGGVDRSASRPRLSASDQASTTDSTTISAEHK